jgi:hypothetical protein
VADPGGTVLSVPGIRRLRELADGRAAAVPAAERPPRSAAVEGNICKVKAIKLSRYGRARPDLLRKIILCAE